MDSATRHCLQLQGISKRFGSRLVLDGISLEIEPGEFFVLLGPSGCGKSTLLNIIAGIEQASTGRLLIGSRDVTRLEPGERDIAMVFQSFALYPTMSVRQNIGFSLKMRGAPAREVSQRVDSMARLLQIEDLLDRKPAELSGGQQQRVAIGRALVRNPTVFLLDEPLSNLDAKLRSEMREELRLLHARTRPTTLYVTHDQLEAMTLATRIAVLKEGRLQQCGIPLAVYRRPANLFVASFVGTPSMRFISGRLIYAGATAALLTDGQQWIPLPHLASSMRLQAGQDVILGIRPENVQVVPGGTTASTTGQIVRAEHTGPDCYLTIAVGSQEIIARAAPGLQNPDERVCLRLDGGAVSLFRPRDGLRLN